MNNVIIKNDVKIENMIYEIRGKQVMLDSDLAKLYNVETKRINEAVKNNIEKFPERYCFKLTDDESNNLLVEIFDQKIEKRGGKYKNPRVFTEQGIYMLATILKSKLATSMTMTIMDTFIAMKKYINYNLIEQKYINKLVLEHDSKIDLILNKLSSKEENNHIFYEGQIYDAYNLLIKTLSKSKKEIIIIDNYAGRELFNIIKDIKVNIKVYTENIDNTAREKYEKQYSNINIFTTDIFHDRFIIIDNKILYHSGASFKDLGKKCFAMTKIDDTKIIKDLLERLKTI